MISAKVAGFIERSSWIRRMFEEGARLAAERGPDRVCDFSLGNPTLEPPVEFGAELRRQVDRPAMGLHRYMPNAGLPETRAAIARHVARRTGLPVAAQHVIMAVGAGGALNASLKAILDPGDEVIVLAPYFPEYDFYIDNHGGVAKVVQTTPEHDLDPQAVAAALGARTRALLINSPNNPSGVVYGAQRLDELARLLREAAAGRERPLYLIADEPYRKVVHDGRGCPELLPLYPATLVCTSHSKDLAIPGERIGYTVIHPEFPGAARLAGALTFTTRILGFVNAPALMQRTVAALQEVTVNPAIYRAKRDLICAVLEEAGYEFVRPGGAFYIFPKSPIPDDVAFVGVAARNGVLVVPGTGFGRAGHFRISFAVPDEVIRRAVEGLRAAREQALAS